MSDDDFLADLNFDGVSREGGQFELLDEGKVILTIADIAINDAKSGNGKVVEVSYVCDNAKLKDWFSLSAKAKWGFRDFLEKLFNTTIEGDVPIKKSELIGMEIGAIVSQQTSQDKFDWDVTTGEKTPRKFNKIELYFSAAD
jgi:hypothetical protein